MTKKIIYTVATIMALAAGGALVSSCNSYDEQPPRNNVSYNRTYKVADPKVLSAEEKAEVNEIRQEYENGTK